MNKEEPKSEESVAETPKEEEPVVEAPKEEEPVAEAPKEEEPVAEAPKEEPVAEAPKEEPVAEAPKEEEPVAEAPKEEEPVAEAPKEEEPVAETPKEEEPVVDYLSNKLDEFRPGDTVVVNIKIKEGDRERIQAFQGNVIKGRFNKLSPPSVESTFTVRRISSGIGVERIFPYFSSIIDSLKVTRKGKVRQGKLYYLRGRTGKSARIKERR